ncbi:unnamed protein product [Rotaria sp. Silwood2]|nr:unnamed protein product [Rotaria sp. Silwood2]
MHLRFIRIELLEDSIQHSTNSYILAKVALTQLIDDINFRILTYLEQQQYPDICVRLELKSLECCIGSKTCLRIKL